MVWSVTYILKIHLETFSTCIENMYICIYLYILPTFHINYRGIPIIWGELLFPPTAGNLEYLRSKWGESTSIYIVVHYPHFLY